MTDAGVEVRDSLEFALTHQKSMAIDGSDRFRRIAQLGSRATWTKTRDYAIVTTKPHEVAEMVACFDADRGAHKSNPPSTRT